MIKVLAISIGLTLGAHAAERDLDALARSVAVVAIYDEHCAKIPEKTRKDLEVIFEYIGNEAKTTAALIRVNEVRQKTGNTEWCALVPKLYGKLLD
jgi:hypothetical protein